jgi:glutamate--cysteine ligase
LPNRFRERLNFLGHLSSPTNNTDTPNLLTQIQRGIEKESLRITPEGKLAQTPHPKSLGSPLTHPYITTDFSEALLELITPVSSSIEQTLDCLDQVHRAVYPQLENEQLWTASMPCVLEGDEKIPVAQYGSSNVATMKTVYRKGLGHRYGRLMQTIAGIHYNFSLPDSLWLQLQQQDNDTRSLQDYKTDAYFNLIRNFKRWSWLLVYLFGASPSVCKSFLTGRNHKLETFDEHSLYLPYGTALRMGDLGYQSSAQDNLAICYNSLDNYTNTLRAAITNKHADYDRIGLKTGDDYKQLSTALLQIENEFYSPIRPKRVTHSGETPLGALLSRGIEYIEVRCIDINPALPLGINAEQIRFLDCFLLNCLFNISPMCDAADRQRIDNNFKKTVNEGRKPGLMLETDKGERSLQAWGNELLDNIDSIAKLLDDAHGGTDYQQSCIQQRKKLADASLTPSAKILADMKNNKQSFYRHAMNWSQQHNDYFRARPLSQEQEDYFKQQKEESLQKQKAIEDSDQLSFPDYLAQYYKQYDALK